MLVAALLITFSSCKKEATSLDDSNSAEDADNVSTTLNSTTDDAANAMGASHALSGKTEGIGNVCGATVTLDTVNGIATIVYNGPDCNNKISRQGTVTVTLENYANGTRWKDAGATLKIDFNSVKVTRIATGGSVTLNGTHYLTNTTGGLAYQIMDGTATGTVAHKHVSDNFSITFADGSQRTWSVRRTRSFSNNGSVRTVTLTGDTTISGVANVDAWGTNRHGDAFYSALTSAIISNSTCGFYRPVSGEYTHHVANRTVDILYNVDSNGTPEASSSCGFGFQITFTKGVRTYTRVVSYWF